MDEGCWRGLTGGGETVLRLGTALDTMKLPPHNSFSESHTSILERPETLRELLGHLALNALHASSAYHLFEDETLTWSDENSVTQIIAYKIP